MVRQSRDEVSSMAREMPVLLDLNEHKRESHSVPWSQSLLQ
jgi:hypothetical protein